MVAKQSWNADKYAENARFVADLAHAVVDLLAPKRSERILDLGCGDGALTKIIADACADVVGVDASANMIEAAKKLGLKAEVMDGEKLNFNREFDAVFTNAALHWMKDLDAVVKGVAKSLKPGGRFVGEFGGFGNVAAIVTATSAVLSKHGIDVSANFPRHYKSKADFSEILEKNNFKINYIEIIPRQTPLKTGMHGWLEVFLKPYLDNSRTDIIDEIVDLLKPVLCDSKGNWFADYVRLRFAANL